MSRTYKTDWDENTDILADDLNRWEGNMQGIDADLNSEYINVIKEPVRPTHYLGQEIPFGVTTSRVHGGNNTTIMQEWLSSIGKTPSLYGTDIQSLRAEVLTHGTGLGGARTGVQTITLYHWAQEREYEILGIFKRANNSNTADLWGKWQEEVFVVAKGENENGEFVRYSDGTQECRWVLDMGSRIAFGSGTYGSIFRTTSFTWTFPAEFNSAPTLSAIGRIDSTSALARANTIGFRTISPTSATWIQCYALSSDNTDVNVTAYLTAQGRWR